MFNLINSDLVGSGLQSLQSLQRRVETSFEDAIRNVDTSQSSKSQPVLVVSTPVTAELVHPLINSSIGPAEPPSANPEGIRSEAVALQAQWHDLETMQRDLMLKAKQIEDLRQTNESLLSEGHRLGKRLGTLEEKHRERLGELDLSHRQRRDLETRLHAAEAKLQLHASLQSECEQLQEQLSAERNARCLADMKLRTNEEASEARARASVLESELSKLHAEKSELVGVTAALSDQVRSLQTEVSETQQNADQFVRLAQADSAAMATRLADLETLYSTAMQRAGALSRKASSEEIVMNRSPSLILDNSRVTELEKSLASHREESSHLRRRLEEAEEELERHRRASNQNKLKEEKSVELRIAQLQSENSKLAEQLALCESMRKTLAESLNRYISEEQPKSISISPPTRSAPTEDIAQLQKRYELALQAIGQLQDELDESLDVNKALKDLLNSATASS